MKRCLIHCILPVLIWAVAAPIVSGQIDDIYYNPDTDTDYFSWHDGGTRHNPDKYYQESWRDESYQDDPLSDSRSFDDRDYTYFDDYAYHYSSRIRRFHRPVYGAGFFDPFYTNMGFYDPFLMNPFSSNLSIYIGFNQFGWNSFQQMNPWNRWNRWNRWNSWGDPFFGMGGMNPMSPWGFNNWGGGFGNTWFVNNYFGDPFFGNPYFSNAYCPPTHWVNTGGFTGEVDTKEVYFGPRKARSGVAPNSGVVSRSGEGNTQSALREARLRDGRNNATGDNPGQARTPSSNARSADRPTESIRMRDVPRTGSQRRETTTTPTTRPSSRYQQPAQNRERQRVERPTRTSRPSTYQRSSSSSGSRSSGYQRSSSPSRSSSASPSRSSSPTRSSGSSSSSGRSSSGRSSSVPSSGSSNPRTRRGGGGE